MKKPEEREGKATVNLLQIEDKPTLRLSIHQVERWRERK